MKRILVMGLSFGIAVGVADLIYLAFWWPPIEEAPYAAILILLYITLFAALPGLSFVTLSQIIGPPGWLGHMFAGCCVAAIANFMFYIMGANGLLNDVHFWPNIEALLAGVSGGFVYWRLAPAHTDTKFSKLNLMEN